MEQKWQSYPTDKHQAAKNMEVQNLARRQLRSFAALIILILIILAALALASWNVADPSLNTANDSPITNWLGFFGAAYADFVMQFLGLGSVVGLLAPFFWAILLLKPHVPPFSLRRFLFWPISCFCFSTALSALTPPSSWPLLSGFGGLIGDKIFNLCQSFLLALPLPQTISVPISIIIPFIIMAPLGLWLALYAGGVIMPYSAPHRQKNKTKNRQEKNVISSDETDQDSRSTYGFGVLIGQILHLFMWLTSITARITPKSPRESARQEPNFSQQENNKKERLPKDREKRQFPSPAGQAATEGTVFELPYLDYFCILIVSILIVYACRKLPILL